MRNKPAPEEASAVSQPQPYHSPRLFLLLFRLELLALLTCCLGAGFAVAAVINDTVAPWLFAVASAAGEGILLGLISRFFFRRFSFPLRLTAALAATLLGLVVMGGLTRGLIGADPSLPAERRPDWGGLALMAIGSAAATLALVAWRKHVAAVVVSPLPAGEVIQEPQPVGASEGKTKTGMPAQAANPLRDRLRGVTRFFRRSNRDAEVRLIGAEKFKCPYCLQPIEARDPRGVVVCPICKTRHHKDCWDITGMCQVPHYHT
jgi:ribosomal protein L37AE/L43A